ncbi:MAG: phage major capsid protein [Lysobacter sp.]
MNHNSLPHRMTRELKNREFKGASDGLSDIAGLADALAKRDAEIKNFTDGANARLLEVEQKLARRGTGAEESHTGPEALNTAYKGVLESDGLRAMRESGATTTGRIELGLGLKALTSLQGSPETVPAGINVQPVRTGFVLPPQHPNRILEVLPSRPITTNSLEAPMVDSASLSQADYQEGEGVEKEEGVFITTDETFYVATIAEHITVSKQVLADEATLMGTINRLLTYWVLRKANLELLSGDGAKFHIKGLFEYATAATPPEGLSPADRIGYAMAVHQNQGFQPSLVLVNPTDWFLMSSERNTDGGYVAGGWDKPAAPTVWNTRVVPASEIPAGKALVVDTGWLEVLDRQQATVMISDQHDRNFTKNLVTILGEIRVGLYVANSGAVVEVDLTEPTP